MEFLTDRNMAVLVLECGGAALLMALLGLAALALFGGRSPVIRSFVAAVGLAGVGLALVLAPVFYWAGVSWTRFELPKPPAPALIASPAAEPSVPAPKAEAARQLTAIPTAAPRPTSPAPRGAVMAVNAFGALWALGTVFLVLRLLHGLSFLRGFLYEVRKVGDERTALALARIAGDFKWKEPPRIFLSNSAPSPLSMGLWRTVVVIPAKLYPEMTDDELRSVLFHELAHIHHCDHLAGVLQRLLKAANWWNPLVYILSAEFSNAREDVADHHAVVGLGDSRLYSRCLADLAEKACLINSLPAVAAMAGNVSGLRKRMKKIITDRGMEMSKLSLARRIVFGAVFCGAAVALAGAGPGSSGTAVKAEAKVPRLDMDALLADGPDKLVQLIQKEPASPALEATVDPQALQPGWGDKIVAAWTEALKRRPNDLQVLRNAGAAMTVLDPRLAKDCLGKALALKPDMPHVALALGWLNYSGKNFPAAAADFMKAFDQSKARDCAMPLLSLAKAYFRDGDMAAAKRYAEQALNMSGFVQEERDFLEFQCDSLLGQIALRQGLERKDLDYANRTGVELAAICRLVGHEVGPADFTAAEAWLWKSAAVYPSAMGDVPCGGILSGLAKELYQFGRKDAVVKFINRCEEKGRMTKDVAQREIESLNACIPRWLTFN